MLLAWDASGREVDTGGRRKRKRPFRNRNRFQDRPVTGEPMKVLHPEIDPEPLPALLAEGEPLYVSITADILDAKVAA